MYVNLVVLHDFHQRVLCSTKYCTTAAKYTVDNLVACRVDFIGIYFFRSSLTYRFCSLIVLSFRFLSFAWLWLASLQDPTAEIVKMNKMFYPKSWLEAVGFFDSLEVTKLCFEIYTENRWMGRLSIGFQPTQIAHPLPRPKPWWSS